MQGGNCIEIKSGYSYFYSYFVVNPSHSYPIQVDFIGVERVKGIEPSSQAWEAHILPLNHTRECDKTSNKIFVEVQQMSLPLGFPAPIRPSLGTRPSESPPDGMEQ